MEIYIVRHGTTAWNAKGMIQGRSDTVLDDIGQEMTYQTRDNLQKSGTTFVKVFSSPLKRAYVTAKTIAPYADIVTDERLLELSFGRYEGRITTDMMNDQKCSFRFFKKDPSRYDREISILKETDPEGGYETLTELCLRAGDFMKDKIEPLAGVLASGDKILISGHGAVNRALMMHLEKRTGLKDFWGSGLSSNCAMIKISCTSSDKGISYDVQDEDLIFYDRSLLDHIRILL